MDIARDIYIKYLSCIIITLQVVVRKMNKMIYKMIYLIFTCINKPSIDIIILGKLGVSYPCNINYTVFIKHISNAYRH